MQFIYQMRNTKNITCDIRSNRSDFEGFYFCEILTLLLVNRFLVLLDLENHLFLKLFSIYNFQVRVYIKNSATFRLYNHNIRSNFRIETEFPVFRISILYFIGYLFFEEEVYSSKMKMDHISVVNSAVVWSRGSIQINWKVWTRHFEAVNCYRDNEFLLLDYTTLIFEVQRYLNTISVTTFFFY